MGEGPELLRSGRWCLVESEGISQLEEKEGGGKTGLKNVASSGDAAVGTERGRTMTAGTEVRVRQDPLESSAGDLLTQVGLRLRVDGVLSAGEYTGGGARACV